MKQDFDVAIIGGGVAGMTSAIYLKRAGISCVIIEKSSYGGQILLAPKIENYPGYIEISGIELSENIYNQTQKLGIPFVNKEVVKAELKHKNKKLYLKDLIIECKKVIIATGRHSRKLNIPGEKELIGKGISYCVTCDGNFYKDKEVAIIGSGNSAFQEAIYLSNICSKVYIIARTENIRADIIEQDKIKEIKNIYLLKNKILNKLNIKDEKLDSVIIEDRHTEEKTELEIKCCFTSIGFEPSSDIFEEINIDKNGYIITDNNCRTNIDGVYAAGDIIKKAFFQLIPAMNDGIIAAYSCINELKKKTSK